MREIKKIFNILLATFIIACTSFNLAYAAKATDKNISLNFENVSLDLFLKEVEKIFKVSFIYDTKENNNNNTAGYGSGYSKSGDNKEAADARDTKITFRTNNPFSADQAWAVVDAFLNIAGLARVQISESKDIFKITKIDSARQEAVPSMIGVDPNELPDSGIIRYVYFLKNSSAEQMKQTLDRLKSKNAIINIYTDLGAIIITDHAYNIKTMMRIVKELDSSCTPITLSVLRMKNGADAEDVAELYNKLKSKGSPQAMPFGPNSSANKTSDQSFLQEANVFAEPRTNSLIIIGPPEANTRIEEFITKHIFDAKVDSERSNLHYIKLNHLPAEQVAKIFNEITSFGASTNYDRYGSVNTSNKYFGKMHFEPEPQSGRVIVRGEEEDFLKVKKIIEELDQAQPQVAIEVLIVSLEKTNTKGTSSQIHNKNNGKVNFQTTGFGGTGNADGTGILLSDSGSLVSNLISLATSAKVGSTVLSLGTSSVWSLLSILSQDTKTNVISNPFLVTTNKYPATTSLGEERRVVTETIQGGSSGSTSGQSAVSAELSVKITPRINSLGIINLDVDIIIEDFSSATETNGNKNSKTLRTNASLADGEVLAIGGLAKSSNKINKGGLPILSKIPVVGNLFKSKQQTLVKENLVVFITPKIITPDQNLNQYTQNKADFATGIMKSIDRQDAPRDPIAKWVFKDEKNTEQKIVSDFIEKNKPTIKTNKTRKSISNSVKGKTKSGGKIL